LPWAKKLLALLDGALYVSSYLEGLKMTDPYAANTTIHATLGTLVITTEYTKRKLYQHAADWDTYKIKPQRAEIQLVTYKAYAGTPSTFIRIVLKGEHTATSGKGPLDKGEQELWETFGSTHELAQRVGAGHGTGWIGMLDERTSRWAVVGRIELSSNHTVTQHSDATGLVFYSDGRPMLRITKVDGSPVGISKRYHVGRDVEGAVDGMWTEWML
jgi:hypothetical protein